MESQEELCVEVIKKAPSFLKSGKWTDCKFVVGAEPHQGVVGAYKLVMAMASPVFEAMFYGSLAETRDIVDVELEIFKAMLRYIYTGKIKLSSCDEAVQLYYTANKYMLHHLMEECFSYLQSYVNLGNVCQLYENSQLYQDEALAQKCINIFTENTKELLQDSSFKDAALSTVEKIFSMDELTIDSEADLINAAALYVSAQDDKIVENQSSSPGIYTTPHKEISVLNVEDNVKGVSDAQNTNGGADQETPGSSHTIIDTMNKHQIRSIVRHIRFLTLTPQQYADCTARSSLLTLLEDNAVLMNLVSNNSSVPMPSGLSTCKEHRVGKTRSKMTTFRYTMQNFSSLKNLEWSPVFWVEYLPWQLKVSLKYKEGIKYLALLVSCNEEEGTDWSCDANVEIRLICHNPSAENVVEKLQCLFSRVHSNTGDLYFLPWYTVLDPTEGYIQDDAVTIEVHVAVEEIQFDMDI